MFVLGLFAGFILMGAIMAASRDSGTTTSKMEITRLHNKLKEKDMHIEHHKSLVNKAEIERDVFVQNLENDLKQAKLANKLNKVVNLPPGKGYYVYEYFNSESGEILYIGKGKSGRFAEYDGRHLGLRKLRDKGLLSVRLLQEGIEYSEDAEALEKDVITLHSLKGTRLYNTCHNPKPNRIA